MKFKAVASTTRGSEKLGPAWFDHSLPGCGTKCKASPNDPPVGEKVYVWKPMPDVMYNSQSGLCTPGSFLQSGTFGTALAPSSTEGDLFVPSSCDTSDGFTYVTSGAQYACLMVSYTPMHYFSARDFCLSFGAHLYVGRSMAKLNLLPHGTRFFIGLTDIATEGRFVWQDTGYAITATFKKQIFNADEPNNKAGEDCVSIIAGGSHANGIDIYCGSEKSAVACERPFLK
ncbi:hypothetical protein EGW08_002401 [Elysia chlorotica]|uniref:C-type lectin domain-containing protein n=1 Tax=Elysia chlorotica TaxID=188477 RepID=A0A433U7T8_ELYCH|nr:hypothetical protein EGW08_002401 [Elysia chlorotica]